MSLIYIVGLGPGDVDNLTIQAKNLLDKSNEIYFRTKNHNCFEEYKNKKSISFDSYYERYDTFELVYENIAKNLLENVKNKESIVYGVPGNPKKDDYVVNYLKSLKDENVKLKFIYGISLQEASYFSIDLLKDKNYISKDAFEVSEYEYDYTKDNLITSVFNRFIASDLKMTLLNFFDSETEIYFIDRAMNEKEKVIKIPLKELDRLDSYSHLSAIYIFKHPKMKGFVDLLKIMNHLRGDEGCPWDRKQTLESLREYLLEESYEVIDAIDKENYKLLNEELGDLLLQVVFQAEILKETQNYNIFTIIDNLVKKLINRHPHVFENEESDGSLKIWNKIKKQEKEEKYIYQSMERIPEKLPSLLKAQKIQLKAKQVGFDWSSIDGAYDKLMEEIQELKEAREEKKLEELGDVLFSVVNISRFIDVNPSFALNKTNKKFIDRFKKMEKSSLSQKKGIENLELSQMELLWNDLKS
ncbi:MAG: nucleoside triphosphate pyrophosphohydrolase [Bacillota bacterium]